MLLFDLAVKNPVTSLEYKEQVYTSTVKLVQEYDT